MEMEAAIKDITAAGKLTVAKIKHSAYINST